MNKFSAVKVAVLILTACASIGIGMKYVYAGEQVTITVHVGVAQAEIENLAINPPQAYWSQAVDFTVTLRNTGEVIIGTSSGSKIEILTSENAIVGTINLYPSSENLAPGAKLDLTASWNVGITAPGSYQAKATVYYDNSSISKTENFSIAAGPSTEVTIPEIPAGGQENVAVENVAVTEISISVVNAVENVKIYVEQPVFAPENTPETPKQAYRYLVFTTENITDADISSVTIKFSVERSWLQLNNLSESEVVLCRLQGGTWQELQTSKTGENSTHIHYSATSPSFSTFAIVAGAAPTPSPPAALPKPEIPVEERLKLNRLPVVLEMRPGEAKLEYLSVLNQSGSRITGLQVSFVGVPENWVSIVPSTFSLDAGEEATLNVTISVPSDALTGDYGLQITVAKGTARAESTSLIRVKPYPSGYVRASVTRLVALDREENRSLITLSVRNGSTFAEVVELVEEIPKSMAENTSLISFTTTPAEILENDPVVKWVLENLESHETRTISYSIARILPDYTSYAYWPVKQLTVVYERVEMFFKVVDLVTPTLVIGENGTVKVSLLNMNTHAMNVIISLDLPTGWVCSPEQLSTELNPRDAAEFSFSVTCPAKIDPGLYLGELHATYEGGEFTQGLTFNVTQPTVQLRDYVPYLVVLGCAVAIAVIVMKWPRRPYRKRVVELLKRIKREGRR